MASSQVRYTAEGRREQILEVATQLFARQGFQGTTTRQIAERAQVNEAIIFRHFPTKDDLYWEILDAKCKIGAGQQKLLEKLRSDAPFRDVFSQIAREWLERRAKDSTLTRLLLFSALENHRLSHRFFRIHIAQYYEALAEYIRQRIAEGSFRDVDPLLAARGFIGMVVYHFQIQELFGGKRFQKFDAKHVAETLADIWLQGMLPREASSAATPRASNCTGRSKTQ
jgi:AcrR family transcriptional regulator